MSSHANTLSPVNLKVLKALNDSSGDFCFQSFATLMKETGLDRKVVRRACRFLARRGYAEFARGLWTDEGEVAGSGYAATKEGLKYVRTQGS